MNRTTIKKATGLAGAVAIAGGSQAYGAIVAVTPPANLTNTAGSATTTTINWDVNGDGTADFQFSDRYPNIAAGSYGVVWQENMNPATSALATTNGVVGYQGSFVRYASALTAGTSIATASAFSTSAQVVLGSRYSYGGNGISNYGGFAAAVAPGTFRYAGFRFNATDGTHFGWIQLAVNAGTITFVNAAYQSTPATAIIAGAVPEPGSMAALALGAAAVVGAVSKRRRSK